jgi:hypothetical protein
MNLFITITAGAGLTLGILANPAIASVSFFNPGSTHTFIGENGFPGVGELVIGPIYDNQFEYLGTAGVHLQGDIITTLAKPITEYSVNFGVGSIGTQVAGDAGVVFDWDFRVEVVGAPVFDVTVEAFSEDLEGDVEHDSLTTIYSGITSDQTFSDSGVLQTLNGNVMTMFVRIDFVSGDAGDSVHVILPPLPDGGFTLTSVPAPGAGALLGMGGIAAARRRRA